MATIEIPRPTSGDVVDRILEDHRFFEELLRELRDVTGDRETARRVLADVLIAHGEAEEERVYPRLRRRDAISGHDAEHGEEEHAEGNEALLALLECDADDDTAFDDAVESLATALNHHIGEEEQSILNPARTEVDEQTRTALGSAWLVRRNELIDQGCGDIENVRRIVQRAETEGLLDEDAD